MLYFVQKTDDFYILYYTKSSIFYQLIPKIPERFGINNLKINSLKRSRAPDKLACQGRRERLQQAPGAFAPPGFGGEIITQPPKVGNGTRRLQKRGTSGACYILKSHADKIEKDQLLKVKIIEKK